MCLPDGMGLEMYRTAVLVAALLSVFSVRADYDKGQRALETGRTDIALLEWRAAAADGDRRAMVALGRLYVHGLGVLQDYVEAYKWFNLAASRGAVEAVQERDVLSEKMTPDQIAAAQTRAAEWRDEAVQAPDTVRLTSVEASQVSVPNDETADSPRDPPSLEEIREAQTLLEAIGYIPGPADGRWGPRSMQAYSSFLRDASLPAEKVLSQEGLRVIREKAYGGGTHPEVAAPQSSVPDSDEDARTAAARSEQQLAEADDAAFSEAENKNCRSSSCKVDAYASYLRLYPEGRHANKAQRLTEEEERLVEDEAHADAKSKGTAESYQQYLLAYPDGRHSNEARQLHANATRAEARQELSVVRGEPKGSKTMIFKTHCV